MSLHEALEALSLDEFQRDAACTEKTAVVTAGAGAGKTRALVGRFLYLVLEKGIDPEQILALTFTRKAAAEMFQRVHEALGTLANPRPDLADRLVNAHIQTLDSFCREVVAASATLYGYTPDFQLDDVACAELATKVAYRYVLDNRGASGLQNLLSAFGFDVVVRELFASFGSANVGPHWEGRHICRASAHLGEEAFRHTASQVAEEMRGIAEQILEKEKDAPPAGFKEGTRQAIRAARAFLSSGAPPGSPTSAELATFFAYMQRPENAINLRSIGKNETESAIKALAKELRDESRLSMISQIVDFERFLPDYYAIMDRLDEYADLLCEEKRRANIMNYKDLGALAVDILSSQEEVRRYWASRFQYILIDEFQDNNELQKQLLLLLSRDGEQVRRGKLFFVGDEKQSIYLFRGADVSVFKSLAEELGASRFSLVRNYRSARRLIAFFNAAFSAVMQPTDRTHPRHFEATYQTMEAHAAEEPPDFKPRIEYHCITAALAPRESQDSCGTLLSTKETLAYRLARWIRAAVESPTPLFVRTALPSGAVPRAEAQPALRKAEYGDIAILMRTTSRQYELEKYLRMFAIPFFTDTAASLFSEEPVNDLYYLLRLLLDGHDLFATAAVLRSPLCRISNDGYVAILTEQRSLADLEAGIPETLSAHDRASVRSMLQFYDALRQVSDHLPLMELVAYVWQHAQLERSIRADPQRHPYLDHWNVLRTIAADTEARGGHLQAFLATLRGYIGQEQSFDANAAPKGKGHGVQLLTIHKAKGLEFPIVIIPWMESATNRNAGSELWGVLESTQDKTRFYTVDIGFHDRVEGGSNILQTWATELRREKERAETKRLLYVACTRAIDHLIMFDAAPEKRAYDQDSFHAILFQSTSRIHPAVDVETQIPAHLAGMQCVFEPLAFEQEVRAARSSGAASAQPALEEPSEVLEPAQSPPLPPPHRLTASALNALGTADSLAAATARERSETFVRERLFEPPSLDDWGLASAESAEGPDPTVYGSLVHELFVHLASGKPVGQFTASATVARELRSTTELPSILERAWRELDPLFRSESFSHILHKAAPKFEVPFLLGLSPWVVEGRIDMLAEADDEVVVLDLKTDRRFSPQEYALQLGIYRIAARALFPTKKIHTGLLYLHFGEVVWLEGEPDEEHLLRLCAAISYNQGRSQ
jgi:ATP-dependent exoDNAse (exonuclease V) beta subunit